MKTLIGLILVAALFVGGTVQAAPSKAWHPPTVLCERISTARENPKAMRWLRHLPFTTIDCSGGGPGQQDE